MKFIAALLSVVVVGVGITALFLAASGEHDEALLLFIIAIVGAINIWILLWMVDVKEILEDMSDSLALIEKQGSSSKP